MLLFGWKLNLNYTNLKLSATFHSLEVFLSRGEEGSEDKSTSGSKYKRNNARNHRKLLSTSVESHSECIHLIIIIIIIILFTVH